MLCRARCSLNIDCVASGSRSSGWSILRSSTSYLHGKCAREGVREKTVEPELLPAWSFCQYQASEKKPGNNQPKHRKTAAR